MTNVLGYDLTIYTDGACKGNPGLGGWGALIERRDNTSVGIYGGAQMTTNNRMELMAAIKALSTVSSPSKILMHTDSQYVLKGITEWLLGWKARGWVSPTKQPVKNVDLWKQLDFLANSKGHNLKWVWVKGHSDNPGNTIADALANKGCTVASSDKVHEDTAYYKGCADNTMINLKLNPIIDPAETRRLKCRNLI